MYDFTEQIVIVTGATGNLGSAAARLFADAGARLALPVRSVDKLTEKYPDLIASHRVFVGTPVDLTNAAQVNAFVDETLAHFGRIDVLFNAAGGYRAGKSPHETGVETWDFMLDLNARVTLLINRAVVSPMLAQGRGKIINTAARSALQSGASDVAYSASKAAVARITESMAEAYKLQGINVNAILPGTIDTPENREAMPDANFSKWVTPAAIAEVVLFLASDAAAPIHGALIPAYGLS
jgi:NAD(P)-dependent dehydrogenase (short-subunit alcohol dehydrogenase family)